MSDLTQETIEGIQSQTEGLVIELVRHGSLDTSCLAEDATWFLDTAAQRVRLSEVRDFFVSNLLESPVNMPYVSISQATPIGSECISVVGKVEYHYEPDSTALMKLSFHADWVLADGEWRLKTLLTTRRKALGEDEKNEIDPHLDFETIYNALPIGVISCFVDEMFAVQHMNTDMTAMLGYSSISDFRHSAGKSLLGIVHPEDLEVFRSFVDGIGLSMSNDSVLIRLRKKDFSFLWVQLRGYLAEGQWLVFACIDHSAHKDELDELTETMERERAATDAYRTIVDNMPGGFHRCTLTPPVHVEFVSDNLCLMSGYTRREIFEDLKAAYINLVHPDDRHIIVDALPSLMAYPHTERFDYRLLRKDGTVVPVTDAIRSVRDDNGDMWAYSVVLEKDAPEEDAVASRPTTVSPVPKSILDEAVPMQESQPPRVEIRTFGYFEVLVDGKPIHFRSEKAREMLAVLTDRAGGYVTRGAIIASLWENEGPSKAALGRCRKTFKTLRDELAEYGIEDIVESSNGARRIVPENVKCDLVDFRNGDPMARAKFRGSYMLDYSWAESTLAELMIDTHWYDGSGPTLAD